MKRFMDNSLGKRCDGYGMPEPSSTDAAPLPQAAANAACGSLTVSDHAVHDRRRIAETPASPIAIRTHVVGSGMFGVVNNLKARSFECSSMPGGPSMGPTPALLMNW